MIRLLFFAVILCVGCKMAVGRWPWEFMRGTPTRSQALIQARKLLGVHADASRNDINEAHRRLIAMVHPDRGGTNGQVHEANAARDLLFDELPNES